MVKPKQSEKLFREQILDLARVFGWKAYFTWKSIHSPAGFPDLVLARDGVLLFAELKTDEGELTESQREWLLALSECVGPQQSVVWRPCLWDDIVGMLKDV